MPLDCRHEPGGRSKPLGLSVTFLSLGLSRACFSKLFPSDMKLEVGIGVLGCCGTNWYFAECVEATEKYVEGIK